MAGHFLIPAETYRPDGGAIDGSLLGGAACIPDTTGVVFISPVAASGRLMP
jgi:hypothetical protein